MNDKKIAFIGLGNMGGSMAANLVKAGFEIGGSISVRRRGWLPGKQAYRLRRALPNRPGRGHPHDDAAIARSLRSADDQRGGWRLLMITARTSSGIVFVEQTNCGAIFTAAPQGELSRPLDDPNVSDSRIDGQFIERSRDHANHLERQAMKCLRTMAA